MERDRDRTVLFLLTILERSSPHLALPRFHETEVHKLLHPYQALPRRAVVIPAMGFSGPFKSLVMVDPLSPDLTKMGSGPSLFKLNRQLERPNG